MAGVAELFEARKLSIRAIFSALGIAALDLKHMGLRISESRESGHFNDWGSFQVPSPRCGIDTSAEKLASVLPVRPLGP